MKSSTGRARLLTTTLWVAVFAAIVAFRLHGSALFVAFVVSLAATYRLGYVWGSNRVLMLPSALFVVLYAAVAGFGLGYHRVSSPGDYSEGYGPYGEIYKFCFLYFALVIPYTAVATIGMGRKRILGHRDEIVA